VSSRVAGRIVNGIDEGLGGYDTSQGN